MTLWGYNGDPVPACVARPMKGGTHLGLLLVHSIHGYEEHMSGNAEALLRLT